ncbi:hypothetical protein BO70DRAFT_430974 [Aspergillus heteromorphus CBS 117.55]|uniref:Uncharacterized protein n=1 Tax=Aspergillus heteromorphus CBS 117.55 TaxID=1448321 RepID=A0A317VRM6_9EURO|nr:uncharacterized protein BO70DRAFT_430974 [Aspergillus heteromorphus CBS 117.55]PWY75542.1 hypothetical protein BO70DRAFT_430974 [Aspergillus heteromorphus CBS 117.55]
MSIPESNSILSILTGTWTLDSENEIQIVFYENGTGELILRHIFNAWIAAETHWKCLSAEPLDQILIPNPGPSSPESPTTTTTTTLLIFPLEITLTPTPSPPAAPQTPTSSTARTCSTRPSSPRRTSTWAPEYMYQLVFDRSPFPPREEWRDQEGGVPEPPFLRIEGWREFCRGVLTRE